MTLILSTVILVDSYHRTPLPDGNESNESIRLAHALSSSGLSITLTSLCSVMAFFVGSFVDMPGISAFCIYAAWSFLANDILQFLVFVPLMVIDNRRISKKRNFCCPCFCGHDVVEQELSEIVSGHHADKVSTNSTNISTTVTSVSSEAHPNANGPKATDSARQSSCLSKMLLPVMTNRIPRLLIIALFLCTLFGSIYVIRFVNTESKMSSIVPDGSMVLDFQRALDRGWGGAHVDRLDIVIKNQDFSDIAVRDKVHELIADLESQDDALDAVDHWLDEFAFFLNETALEMDTMDSNTFYRELQSFSNGTRWESEITYDDPLNPMQIKSTRFRMAIGVQVASVAYQQWDEIFDVYFPSVSSGFIFYEASLPQYLQNRMLSLTASNMMFAANGVLCILMLFMDLRVALFLLVIVAMIDVHLMAWMWALDISLESVTFIVLVMAVGLTVDYLIHITNSIVEAQPQGDISRMSHHEFYNSKLQVALDSMGVSVWFVLCDTVSPPFRSLFILRICLHTVYVQQRCPDYVHRSSCFGVQSI